MATTTKTFTRADGTLFHIAASQMGDPLQWWRLAQANGLSDPILTGFVTLKIPTADTTNAGGVPPQ